MNLHFSCHEISHASRVDHRLAFMHSYSPICFPRDYANALQTVQLYWLYNTGNLLLTLAELQVESLQATRCTQHTDKQPILSSTTQSSYAVVEAHWNSHFRGFTQRTTIQSLAHNIQKHSCLHNNLIHRNIVHYFVYVSDAVSECFYII